MRQINYQRILSHLTAILNFLNADEQIVDCTGNMLPQQPPVAVNPHKIEAARLLPIQPHICFLKSASKN